MQNLYDILKMLSQANKDIQIVVIDPRQSLNRSKFMMPASKELQRSAEHERKVKEILCCAGIPSTFKGYRMLQSVILMSVSTEYSYLSMKELYGSLAEKHNSSAVSIHRSIRYALDTAWDSGKLISLNKILGYDFIYGNRKPYIKEFIMAIAEYLRDAGGKG
ncbi:MAG: sporulation initiation factor Spo0A C-terminal domain-containing protein [Lachnospiraceae bacterium]|jgi:two-component system response regulator (stage 0 sporulation protein A)|nr:sporulation initiation factor Spo0A C-terminal domain-containing protein [Lachnospiraceae bacterium]